MNLFKQHFFHRIHQYLTPQHQSVLAGISSRGMSLTGGSLFFGVYPVIITTLTGSETSAGLFISVTTIFQLLMMDTLAGPMIDKYGVKKIGILGITISLLSGIPFLFAQNIVTATILFLGLLFRASFLVVEPLILQNTKSKDGGFWFGIREEICSIGSFIGALAIPFFLLQEQWFSMGVVWMVTQSISLGLLLLVRVVIPAKTKKQETKKGGFFKTVSAGLNFIKVNHKYPLFTVGTYLFNGLFYGAIWFIFPIYIAEQVVANNGSLSLGIHEIMKLTLAIICGVLADRLNWKILEEYAWVLMIMMAWVLPFWHTIDALILVGMFMGIAANFFTAAGNHALSTHDEDHEEDGQFSACARLIGNIGYGISPIIIGFLYQYFGFSISLMFLATGITLIGLWMISLCTILQR